MSYQSHRGTTIDGIAGLGLYDFTVHVCWAHGRLPPPLGVLDPLDARRINLDLPLPFEVEAGLAKIVRDFRRGEEEVHSSQSG